jgi:hypothetical protein
MASDKLGAASWADEASWGEDNVTFTTRMPLLSAVDVSGLEQAMIEADRVVQYRNDGTPGILGPQGGGFSTEFYLTGHGSPTSGATALTSLFTLLGKVLGASAPAAAAGSTFTGGTALVPLSAASGTFAAGGLCRIGTANDGRGGGQFHAIGTHVANSVNLLTGAAVAPINGDIMHSAELAYTVEAPGSFAMTGIRWNLQTATHQYTCHGCYPKALSFSGAGKNGEFPKVKIDWGLSWFAPRAATFPNALSVETFPHKPVSQSSFFLAPVGTVARAGATRNLRSFSIDYTLGVQPLMGVGGVGPYQAVVGAKRTPDDITITIEEDAEAATTAPALAAIFDACAAGTAYHALYTLSAVPGAALAMRFNRLFASGPRPVQHSADGVNLSRISFKARTSITNTTDLTSAAFILGAA